MEKALRVAASGMEAQKLYIDVIANNLANVNTHGFKKSTIEFQDLLYEKIQLSETTAAGQTRPVNIEIGSGTRPVATHKSFSQGEIQSTNNSLDLAIAGDGFFQIMMPDGTTSYTRTGTFKISGDGTLVTSDGFILDPDIQVPDDAQQINISRDGRVDVIVYGDVDPLQIGEIELARFVNPAGLESMGRNLYRETAASGRPLIGEPGSEGLGTLEQGYLETSNVEIVSEMVNMISAQRAYEINSKSIKTADEMYRLVNNLKS